MRPSKVKGLDPRAGLPDNARKMVAARLADLRSFLPQALDPDQVEAQHEMRIAAKRLRYTLELTDHVLGSQAQTARRAARQLQGVLGHMHDCDVMIPLVRSQIEELEREDVGTVYDRARGSKDLDPVVVQAAPNRAAYRGLELLIVHLRARRIMMFERFRRLWEEQARQGVWVALERSLEG